MKKTNDIKNKLIKEKDIEIKKLREDIKNLKILLLKNQLHSK